MSQCDFIAGWGGGMVGLMVGHPLDTIKVNQQLYGVGIRTCVQTIYKKQQLKGFFRGMGFPLIAEGAMNSVFFGVYGFTLNHLDMTWNFDVFSVPKIVQEKEILNNVEHHRNIQERKISYMNCFVAGLAAGLAQISLACPVDIVRIRLQTKTKEKPVFRGPFVLVKHIIKTEGLMGLYQGVTTMALRDMPTAGIYMLLYEVCSSYVKNLNVNRSELTNSFGIFFAGGIAGTISCWLTLPLDVIKSHVQSQDKKSLSYRGGFASAEYIFKHRGFKGLFRGFSVISIAAFPVSGVTLLCYEWFTYLCHYICDTSNSRLNALGN